MRGRLLKFLMVLLVLIPVGLTAYLANSLYHRKGVPEAVQSLSKQLFQSKAEENKAEQRAQALERKTTELQAAYDSLVADLHGEVDAREIRVRRYREKLEINFVDKVLFASGSADVTPQGRDILVKVAGVLGKLRDKSIYVVGHTDNVAIHSGLYPTNWELSTARAAAVIRYLSDTGKVPPERFTAMGRSFYQPVDTNATPEGRQANRRVEIIVTEAPIFGVETKTPEAQTGTEGESAPPAAPAAPADTPAGLRERALPEGTPVEPTPQPVQEPKPTPPPVGAGDNAAAPRQEQPAPPAAPALPPVLPDTPGTSNTGS